MRLSKAMASTYARDGIRVNVIAPGLTAAPVSQAAGGDSGAYGQPEDIAAAAVYLASDEARSVTGAVLTVDGDWMVHEVGE